MDPHWSVSHIPSPGIPGAVSYPLSVVWVQAEAETTVSPVKNHAVHYRPIGAERLIHALDIDAARKMFLLLLRREATVCARSPR